MSGHTPGPWAVDGSHIYAPDGEIIAQVHNPGRSASDYPLEANRDLMAAAPDLLHELEHLRRCLRPWIESGHRVPGIATLNGADAAIARATGAAP